MVFLFLVCIWHGIVPLLENDVQLSQQCDLWILVTFVVIYVLTQIMFVVIIVGRVSVHFANDNINVPFIDDP